MPAAPHPGPPGQPRRSDRAIKVQEAQDGDVLNTRTPTVAEKGSSVSEGSPSPLLVYLPALYSPPLLPRARCHTLHRAVVGPEDTVDGDKPLFRESPPPRQAKHRT